MENIDKVVWSRIWILLLPIIAALWFLTNSPSWAQNNRCDVFQIFHELDGDELTVKLETDCPESSTLMVSIDRVYDVNDGIAYSESYLNEKSTVGKWKQPQIIDVSHATWRTTLTETRELMSRLGEKYEIGAIEDNIEMFDNLDFELKEIEIIKLYYIYGSIPGIKNLAFNIERYKQFLDSEENIMSGIFVNNKNVDL
ncbi:MAG: hypothetical protein IID52_09475 [Proteobacteria bacterium]|nr:hypothetical protein [Pseudomonadota bacterium]